MMLINVLINMGIMLATIYVYFAKFRTTNDYLEGSFKRYLMSTVGITIVGVLQMTFSIVIYDLRLDFRELLLVLVFRYFDLKTAISSLILLTLTRFFWGVNPTTIINVYSNIYFLISLVILTRYMKHRFSDRTQLLTFLVNNLMVTTLAVFYLMTPWTDALSILAIFWPIQCLMLYFCWHIINDLNHMVDMINQDCLTSLNNQRRFREDLALMDRIEESVSIALIDLDHFKYYNDTYGHEIGDVILHQFAGVLLSQTNAKTVAYRVGGEEFAFIMTGQTQAEAETLVLSLQALTRQENYLDLAERIDQQPTISIGIAHRETGETALDVYRRADQAVYYCKNHGRNQMKAASNQVDVNGADMLMNAETASMLPSKMERIGTMIGKTFIVSEADLPEEKE